MATPKLGLIENDLSNTNRANIVDNFNANMRTIDEQLGALGQASFPCIMSGVGIQPTIVKAFSVGNVGFVTGYATVPDGGNDQVVASCSGLQPDGEGAEEVQFACSVAEVGKAASGLLRRTDTGFDVVLLASHVGTYRFSAAFPCRTVG